MKITFRNRISLAGIAAPVFLLAAAVATVQAGQWQVGVADTTGGGMFSSLRIDHRGNAHVSDYDPSEHQLKYSFWDHNLNRWFTTVVDKSTGFCSLALDSHDQPHIVYISYGKLGYAHWNGSSWEKQMIPIPAREIAFYTSIALDSDDAPRISFYEYLRQDPEEGKERLRTVIWNGKYWELRTVDDVPGAGKFNSIAVDPAGHIHIAYAVVGANNGSLRYAYWDGKSWRIEILEGADHVVGVLSVKMVVDEAGRPNITYADTFNHYIKYAIKVDGKWHLAVVDSIGKEAFPDRNGIALDDSGNPYISYFDAGEGALKLAHREGEKWVREIIEQNFSGLQSSLQIGGGDILLTYSDATGTILKFARRALPLSDSLLQTAAGAPAH